MIIDLLKKSIFITHLIYLRAWKS